MTDAVRALLEDYAVRFGRGEHPDPLEYRDRAGDGWMELAVAIDRFLITAPPPPAPASEVASMRELLSGSPPLLALRRRRGVKRAEVVDALMKRFGIRDALREKMAQRYHELESGLLALSRIDEGVFTTVAETLGVERAEVFAWRAPQASVTVFARAAIGQALLPRDPIRQAQRPMAAAPSASYAGGEPADEVDVLFGTDR